MVDRSRGLGQELKAGMIFDLLIRKGEKVARYCLLSPISADQLRLTSRTELLSVERNAVVKAVSHVSFDWSQTPSTGWRRGGQ